MCAYNMNTILLVNFSTNNVQSLKDLQ